jgi:single-strand DNA-binding protein
MSAQITLIGNVTADPELKFLPSGKALCTVNVVTSKKKNVNGVWEESDTTFWKVTVWDKAAENVADSVEKGTSVIVVGTAAERSWEGRDGQKRTSVEVTAQKFAVDLGRAPVKIDRYNLGAKKPSAVEATEDPWSKPFTEPAEDFPF